jgi:hypothetical protein
MSSRIVRRQDLLQRVASCVVHHRCLKGLTLQGVAEDTGVSLWALRYSFENAPRLFRCVVAYYVRQIGERIAYDAAPKGSVLASIQAYADFLSLAMKEAEYRDFLYLVIRNSDLPWLRRAYQEKIADKIGRELETVVVAAGEKLGMPIALRPGAARRFATRIEAEVVLPTFLPSLELAEGELDKRIQQICRETFEATYTFAWEQASAA